MKIKRGLAILLTVAMSIGLMPNVSFADTVEERTIIAEADTYVNARSGKTELAYNYGGAQTLQVNRGGNRIMPIMRFDTSSVQAPENGVLNSVTLKLIIAAMPSNWSYTDVATNETTYASYRVGRFMKSANPIDDWTEGTADGAVDANGGICGNDVNTTAGNTNTYPETSAVAYLDATTDVGSVLSFDITDIYNDTVTEDGKLSLWMSNTADSIGAGNMNTSMQLYSKEYNNGEFAPELVFTYSVMSNEQAEVNQAADALALTEDGVEIDTSHLTRDIDLPLEGLNGTTITWTTTNSSAVTEKGKVTRPTGSADEASAVLTATVSKGDYYTTKEFEIKVPNIKYPEADLYWFNKSTDANPVDGKRDTFVIRGQNSGPYRAGLLRFTLPQIPQNNKISKATLTMTKKVSALADITGLISVIGDDWSEYTSTYDDVKDLYNNRETQTAEFTIPLEAATLNIDVSELVKAKTATGDAECISFIAYTLNKDVAKDQTFFSREATANMPVLTIETEEVSQEELKAEADKSALIIDTEKIIIDKIELPTVGVNGSEISWEGENIILPDGTVNRPQIGEEDVNVTLTATITNGAYSTTKTFNVTVLSKTYPEADTIVVTHSRSKLNYGGSTRVTVRGDGYRTAYVRFDTTGIEDVLTSAKVSFVRASGTELSDASLFELYAVKDNEWLEGDLDDEEAVNGYICYDNRPETGRLIAKGESVEGNILTFDITDYAALKAAANEEMSFYMVYNSGNEDGIAFYSKECAVDKRPYITVETEENANLLSLYKDMNTVEIPQSTTSDIDLMTNGENGTTVVWTSDNAAISNQGKVTRPQVDTVVTLTAVATNGEATKTFKYAVKVLAPYINVRSLIFTDGENTYDRTQLPLDTELDLSCVVENSTLDNLDIIGIISFYEGDELKGCIVGEDTVDAGKTKPFVFEAGKLDQYAGMSMKIMYWKKNMQPLRGVTDGAVAAK